MKTLLVLSVIALVVVARNFIIHKDHAAPPGAYRNGKYQYQLNADYRWKIDDTIPELVSMERDGGRLRINAGCFDFGTEGLRQTSEAVSLNGIPALKENFYDHQNLRLESWNFNDPQNRCVALELTADSADGWEELHDLIKTFRFTR